MKTFQIHHTQNRFVKIGNREYFLQTSHYAKKDNYFPTAFIIPSPKKFNLDL